MASTKIHSTGQVALARWTFWQLHQINLFSSLCVKSTSSLILEWKGCNNSLLMKNAMYQAQQQRAKWTCWIWITPDARLRPLSSPQCKHGCVWTDEFSPLAWLLPFFHGRWVWPVRSWTHSHKPLSELQSHITSASSEWVAVSLSPFKETSHGCLSVSALHLHQLGIQAEPPLRKGAAGLLQQHNFVGPRQNQEKPRSCNQQEIKAELRILLYHYEFKDSVIFWFMNVAFEYRTQ